MRKYPKFYRCMAHRVLNEIMDVIEINSFDIDDEMNYFYN